MARGSKAAKTTNEDRMDFRLSSEHKALIEKAAAYSGESLTGFAVSTLVTEARRIVREHEIVALSAADRDRFLALLDRPPAPADSLRRAGRRHRDLISRSE
ncbi:MAG TPA: DUF1778 domain-containing protein [Longimicrobiales bacterium]|nr:DUF1778 domain-containing protein [Longimicrobiales bacterium]